METVLDDPNGTAARNTLGITDQTGAASLSNWHLAGHGLPLGLPGDGPVQRYEESEAQGWLPHGWISGLILTVLPITSAGRF